MLDDRARAISDGLIDPTTGYMTDIGANPVAQQPAWIANDTTNFQFDIYKPFKFVDAPYACSRSPVTIAC